MILWFATGCFAQLQAQTDPVIEGSNLEPFSIDGSIGFEAKAYRASGIENRRAPGLAQGTASIDISSFGFSTAINLLYSTDQSELRQNMNQIGFDASWQWLRLRAGDINPEFSKYGLRGVTIRGGHLRLNPGNFLFELTGGRSQRAVNISCPWIPGTGI